MSQPLRQVLPRHRRAFGHGAMTAALAIVPARVAGGIHAVPGEVPWVVRLSTGCGADGTVQQPLAARPWVDSAGITPRPATLSAVPAYRRGSYTF